jgi:hypothetical protein
VAHKNGTSPILFHLAISINGTNSYSWLHDSPNRMSDCLLFFQCISTFMQFFHDGLIQFCIFIISTMAICHLSEMLEVPVFLYCLSVKVIENAHYLEKSGKLQFCCVGIRLHFRYQINHKCQFVTVCV